MFLLRPRNRRDEVGVPVENTSGPRGEGRHGGIGGSGVVFNEGSSS